MRVNFFESIDVITVFHLDDRLSKELEITHHPNLGLQTCFALLIQRFLGDGMPLFDVPGVVVRDNGLPLKARAYIGQYVKSAHKMGIDPCRLVTSCLIQHFLTGNLCRIPSDEAFQKVFLSVVEDVQQKHRSPGLVIKVKAEYRRAKSPTVMRIPCNAFRITAAPYYARREGYLSNRGLMAGRRNARGRIH
ncbi:hypothetical protein BKA67DRAFT_689691 [Truncatella angustata]|uniref:DUF4158 domain-containing protein n=1 Tax=Truncatella angustata TaxID=152316 RepID=A0A9P8UUI0_9PEZI|nr:uncharacterized protein BKA67DRAFT_689691 [Truncatella angustata]KAH6658588.1 hypothetical protein BKA67DRAFT_689691 [Truncatella angustata]